MTGRILVIDDESAIRDTMRMILEYEGYECITAGSGAEGLTAAEREAPDLVFLDIKMPGMDGLEAAREIAGPRKAAVLILTAFSQRDLIEQARDAGALAYLVKPFQKSELLPAVEVALGRFREMQALDDEVENLQEQLETRRVVDRAKGILMDKHGMTEADSFGFIQKTAMNERRTMKSVAEDVVSGQIAPPA